MNRSTVQPFLKWPGGKRWLITNHSALLPTKYGRYIEPFLGSGCVFFHLRPQRALLGDINGELIDVYRALKSDPFGVEEALGEHELNHCNGYYYWVRDSLPDSLRRKAARFIYLNRTCFNGIYRVNREGQFNVPIGTRKTIVFDEDDFEGVSMTLRGAVLRVSDFEKLIDKAVRADFVFADPPYTVTHNNNAFVRYNERLFSWKDQLRLAQALRRARDRGVQVVSTNACHPTLKDLYLGLDFQVRAVRRFCSMAADSVHRNSFEEMMITN
jgi:DNA adenine methylase